MNKPTIFFSHSSADKDALYKLKNFFIKKTGGSLNVFLSSDGQSIPLGRNWVARIQDALDAASILVVFLTPNSLRSNWIYFEAGYAYSKNIKVVPVGFLGVDLSTINPPLSLLQGFNITNEDGLNNLIALVNDTFTHTHSIYFTECEYFELANSSASFISNSFAKYLPYIDEINLILNSSEEIACDFETAFLALKQTLQKMEVEYTEGQSTITGFGFTIHLKAPILRNRNVGGMGVAQDSPYIDFKIDADSFESNVSLVVSLIKEIRRHGVAHVLFRFKFTDATDCVAERHKFTSRLRGTGITFDLSKRYSFLYKEIAFNIGKRELLVIPTINDLDLNRVIELLKILLDNEVLFLK